MISSKIQNFGICLVITCLTTGMVICLLAVLESCGRPISDSETESGIFTEVITKEIPAATGGTINFSDGTSVSFPAGALANDATVTAKKLSSSSLPDQVLSAVFVGPTIESLSAPATVTLKHDPSKVSLGQEVVVAIVGGATSQEVVSSSEVSVVKIISPESQDTAKGLITIKTTHFSWVWAFKQGTVYLAFDFEHPLDILQPGDILYALTGAETTVPGLGPGRFHNASWTPGHVGMYVGTKETGSLLRPGSPGCLDIIESTVAKVLTGKNGVQYGTSYNFKRLGHVYMGARRPKGVTLTEEDRTKIVANAKAKLGWPYFYIDFDNFGIPLASGSLAGPTAGITCVALVENSYNELSPPLYIVHPLRQYLFFPIDQFYNTEPIREVNVKPLDYVQFKVYGVVRDNSSLSKWRTYVDQQQYYKLSISSSTKTVYATDESLSMAYLHAPGPILTSYDPEDFHHVFHWTPTTFEAGTTHKFTVTLDAGENGITTEAITINVLP